MLNLRNACITPCIGTLLGAILVTTGTSGQDPAPKAKKDTPKMVAPKGFGNPEETRKDHQLMLKTLGINSIRPGADGMNKNAPNAANSDENKANRYKKLPDPLVFKNGQPVNSPTDWTQRRKEIVEDFDREIYGRVPKNIPLVKWEVTETKGEEIGNIKAVTKKLAGHVDNSTHPSSKVDIQFVLTIPKEAPGPVPVVIEFGFAFGGGFGPQRGSGGPTWQEQVLRKGWGYGILVPTSFQADNGAGLTSGIIGLCNQGKPRQPEDWGTLRAWAWGASRVLDYLETDKTVDAKRVGIEGLSRYGKAAIVAMAYDERFAIGFIASSGAGGLKILRRDLGERVENLAGSGEYHWMAGNFIKYAGPLNWDDMPVDAHELLAMCAPRPVFISVGSPKVEGNWVDGRGMFIAGVEAGPVYRLLGKKDLGTKEMPPEGQGLTTGEIAFRQHAGGHTTGPNWPTFLEYAGRYFNAR